MSVLTITKDNFEELVLKSDVPVLLDFWATWCGPCMMVSPVVDEIAEENTDFKVGKINVDDEISLAQAFGIQSIPTLVVMKDGKAIAQKSRYLQCLNNYYKSLCFGTDFFDMLQFCSKFDSFKYLQYYLWV